MRIQFPGKKGLWIAKEEDDKEAGDNIQAGNGQELQ
jgi:hypothetical protein